MKKRAAVFLLAVLMAVTVSPAAQAAPASPPSTSSHTRSPFHDVELDRWSYPYIYDLYEHGVLCGTPEGTYLPSEPVTWGASFKLILLAIGVDDPEPLPDEHWAMPYVALAQSNRLLYAINAEYEDAADPEFLDAVPTRLDIARMAARALNLLDIAGESPYPDCEDGYVVELYEKGIMVGTVEDDGVRRFHPDRSITREEVTTIIWRMMNTDVTDGMIRVSNAWVDVLEGVPLSTFDRDQFSLDEKDRLTYSGGYYTRGIDVSGHKQEIDWDAVAHDGIDFAIIRAGNRFYGRYGSGAVVEDGWFDRNMQGAIDAGMDVGAYFFSNAITVEEALEEAELLLAKLEPYREHVNYPVVCDWEYLGGNDSRAYGVDARIITQCIDAFCARVAEEGYIPMVYFNNFCGLAKMDLSKLTKYEFWYAEYAKAPSCIYNFQFWQYSSAGKVAGISSGVDMDLCFVPYPNATRRPGVTPEYPDPSEPPLPEETSYLPSVPLPQ